MPAPERQPGARAFQWEGLDRQGQIRRGVLHARDAAMARTLLRQQGIRVARLQALSAAVAATATSTSSTPLLTRPAAPIAGSSQSRRRRSQRITAKQLALFTRQLATMLRAGLPLLQALDIAIRGATGPAAGALAGLLQAVRRDVARGDSLATALGRHPRHFDALFCHLVAAAEQAGLLESMLERIAGYREKSLALRGKVRAALAYPCAVVLVALLVTVVMMLWVVPAFEQMFSNFGAELPLPTRIVMRMAAWLAHFWPWLLGALALLVPMAMQAWRSLPLLRERAQALSLRLPLLGALLRQAALARWSRTFAALFGAGIALVEALEIVAGAAGNVVYARASLAVRDAVRNGATLHGAMQETGVFSDLAVQMTAVGEESGALDVMLGKVADLCEREVDDTVAALTSLMEPVIMAVLGLVIGGLVIALYLPVFRLGAVT